MSKSRSDRLCLSLLIMTEQKIRELLDLIDLVNKSQDTLDWALNEIGDWFYVSPMVDYVFRVLKLTLPHQLYEDISYYYFESECKIIFNEWQDDELVFDFSNKNREQFIAYLKYIDQI